MPMLRRALLVTACTVLAGCGGKVQDLGAGVDGGADASTDAVADAVPVDFTARAKAYCEREAARAAGCGEKPRLESCLSGLPCLTTLYRPNPTVALFACLETRPCGAEPKACVSSVGGTVSKDGLVAKLDAACRKDASDCLSGCDPTLVGILPFLSDTVLGRLASGPTTPCGSLGTCFARTLDDLGRACSPTDPSPPSPDG